LLNLMPGYERRLSLVRLAAGSPRPLWSDLAPSRSPQCAL